MARNWGKPLIDAFIQSTGVKDRAHKILKRDIKLKLYRLSRPYEKEMDDDQVMELKQELYSEYYGNNKQTCFYKLILCTW